MQQNLYIDNIPNDLPDGSTIYYIPTDGAGVEYYTSVYLENAEMNSDTYPVLTKDIGTQLGWNQSILVDGFPDNIIFVVFDSHDIITHIGFATYPAKERVTEISFLIKEDHLRELPSNPTYMDTLHCIGDLFWRSPSNQDRAYRELLCIDVEGEISYYPTMELSSVTDSTLDDICSDTAVFRDIYTCYYQYTGRRPDITDETTRPTVYLNNKVVDVSVYSTLEDAYASTSQVSIVVFDDKPDTLYYIYRLGTIADIRNHYSLQPQLPGTTNENESLNTSTELVKAPVIQIIDETGDIMTGDWNTIIKAIVSNTQQSDVSTVLSSILPMIKIDLSSTCKILTANVLESLKGVNKFLHVQLGMGVALTFGGTHKINDIADINLNCKIEDTYLTDNELTGTHVRKIIFDKNQKLNTTVTMHSYLPESVIGNKAIVYSIDKDGKRIMITSNSISNNNSICWEVNETGIYEIFY